VGYSLPRGLLELLVCWLRKEVFRVCSFAHLLIQVDIGGHPPIPLAQRTISILAVFLQFFRVPNFWGRFEALNDVFWARQCLTCSQRKDARLNGICTPRLYLSNGVSSTPKKIVCKSYALGKLMYQLPPSGPTNLLVFHLSGLGFWMFRVFSFMFYVKKAFGASLYSSSCE
jgi:hypothetical protein